MSDRRAIQPRGLRRIEAASYIGVSPTKFDEMVRRGATDAEIMAITGHLSREQVTKYTRDANRQTMAAAGILKLRTATERKAASNSDGE